MIDSNLTLRFDALEQPLHRASLLALLAQVFGNDDITLFADSGRWDSTYRSLGYWLGDRCVANVGVFDMPLLVDGRPLRACGVQSVATDPQFRRRGLFTAAMREAVAYIDGRSACSLLFTQQPDLYSPFGYCVVPDDVFLYRRAKPPTKLAAPPRPLSAAHAADVVLLENRLCSAAAISNVFTPQRGPMFWFNELRHGLRRVHDLPDLDALAVFDHDGDRLRLLDVLADRVPPLETLLSAIASNAAVVELWFTPDRFDAACEIVPRRDGDYLMARGPFAIEGRAFAFPPTGYF